MPTNQAITITLTASARVQGRSVSEHAAFVVRRFAYQVALIDPQVLLKIKGHWQPTTHVAEGELVRFGGQPVGMGPHGRVHVCASGTVRIEGKDGRLLQLHCVQTAGSPYMLAQTRFDGAKAIGARTATIHVTWRGGQASSVLPFTVTSR